MFKTIFSGHKTIWGGTINILGALPPNARMATCPIAVNVVILQ